MSTENLEPGSKQELVELRAALCVALRDRNRLQAELGNIIDQLPRLRQLIEHSTDIMLLINEDDVITDCNRSATIELAYARDGLHGKPIRELWAGDASGLLAGLEQAKPERHTMITGDLVRSDKSLVPIEAHIAAFDDDARRFRVVVACNVSDRQQLELALRHIQDQLAFVNERQAMAQELQKSNRLEALGTLAGGIAHDFNNILSVIRGNVEILLELPKEEQQEAIEGACEGLLQASSMAHQLLTFSRGGTVVRKSTKSKRWLVAASRLAMSASTHQLTLDLEDELPVINIDEGQMTQVLHNLIKNAQQSMQEPGTVAIEARVCESVADGKRTLCIYVEDQGPGIPLDLADRVFDPFFSTKEEGTGIGLATSHKIVREHEGTIRSIPNPGRGARFEIALPILKTTGIHESTPHRPPAPMADLTGLRILLMDDEQSVRNVLARTIRIAGATVDECARGEDAVALFRTKLEQGQPYDATVLDLVIRRGMGGIETIGLLCELDPSVRAIVCSGYSDESVQARFRGLGFRAYVAKPFSPSELINAIAEAVGERSGAMP